MSPTILDGYTGAIGALRAFTASLPAHRLQHPSLTPDGAWASARASMALDCRRRAAPPQQGGGQLSNRPGWDNLRVEVLDMPQHGANKCSMIMFTVFMQVSVGFMDCCFTWLLCVRNVFIDIRAFFSPGESSMISFALQRF